MIATSLVWLTAGVSTAGAQIAETFQELSQLVGPGESVSVTDGHGAISRGRIFDLTDSSFRLRTGSATREFSRADVREIQRRHDSLVNGALIGLASGSAVAAILASGVCNSSGFFRTECTPSGVVLTMGALGGIGAGIGVAMDALVVGTRTIYRAPGGTEVVIRVRRCSGPIVSGHSCRCPRAGGNDALQANRKPFGPSSSRRPGDGRPPPSAPHGPRAGMSPSPGLRDEAD